MFFTKLQLEIKISTNYYEKCLCKNTNTNTNLVK